MGVVVKVSRAQGEEKSHSYLVQIEFPSEKLQGFTTQAIPSATERFAAGVEAQTT